MARALRTVAADEKAEPKRAKNVIEAAKSGTYLELQEALRDRLAVAISDPDCKPGDLSPLTRRLQDVVRDIESERLRLAQEADEHAVTPDEDWDAEAL